MCSFDAIFNGDPNTPIEASFPQVSASESNPYLLCWVFRRILYVNAGNGWVQVAQLSPDQAFVQLSEPLRTNVITKLEAEPINSQLCLPFSRLLRRGY